MVTEADLAAEETICTLLRARHPDFGIFSEEQGPETRETEYTWIVDPLDGTNNFVIGIPQFSVFIALTHRQETLLGVVYQPLTDTLWRAVRGQGAWCNDTPLTTNALADLPPAVFAFIQGYQASVDLARSILQLLQGHAKRVVTNWAPSLDWCLLAQGRLAAVVSLDSEREDQLAAASPALHTALSDKIQDVVSR